MQQPARGNRPRGHNARERRLQQFALPGCKRAPLPELEEAAKERWQLSHRFEACAGAWLWLCVWLWFESVRTRKVLLALVTPGPLRALVLPVAATSVPSS